MTGVHATFGPAIPWRRSTWVWLVGLLAVCAALRLFLALNTDPILSLDSQGYLHLAGLIARLDLSADGGMRTPGYPLFILLFGGDPTGVRLAQMGLGLAISAMLFWLGRRMTGSDPLAAAIGAGYGLSLSQIYFESTPLTETLSTFGITLSVIALLVAFARLDDGRPASGWMLVLGLVTAVTALVRPSLVFLPILLAGMMLIKLIAVRALRGAWLLIPALLPTIIVIGGWSGFNYARFGYFGPSILGGFSLTDHSVTFIEYAPDRYAVIRDTYLDLRRQYGLGQVGVWQGVEPLKAKLGLSTVELSRELSSMSMELFLRQPLRYAESVWATWLQFWNAYGGLRGVVVWEGARDPAIGSLLGYAFRAMKYVYTAFNVLFLGWAVSAMIVRIFFRRRPAWVTTPMLVMAAVVLVTALLTVMLQGGGLTGGGNNRYAMPVQPLVVCVVLTAAWELWTGQRASRMPGP
jgi:4-amino-4-deoxy-L-arabinose transferase-like glycosyltransferase